MYWYALVGVIAFVVLVIENGSIIFHSGNSQESRTIRIYRYFLYGVMAYYATDILWGILDSMHLTALLYVDTVIYYVAMAVGVLLWTQYVVTYLADDNAFSRFLFRTGRIFFAVVVTITVINCFTPILFWFDKDGVYHACPARHAQLIFQILLLLLTSVYTHISMLRTTGAVRKRYLAIFMFGLVVALLLLVQLKYPFLPLYTIGYMLGCCLLHTFVVSSEMDEYKQEISEKQRQSELAAAANKAKSAFLSNMSHEIRTPINAILGMNEMVLRESEDQNVLSYSEGIKTAGNTLLGIVNDILDFSKIEAGKMEIIPVDYDLSSVLNDLVNMIQTRADDKGLLLKLDFDRETPKLLHGDEVRIKQVATNILTNAVKYTEKGSVTFSVGFERIPDDDDRAYLKVAIKDTGIGIKPEDMKKLFSEFERIEEKRNRKVEGTGLGMTITKRLLEMMGTSLKVESVYGEGSVFSFRLEQRVVKWEQLGDYEESYRASLSQHKKSVAKFSAPDAVVLVVDDTPMNLMVFKSLLKRTNVQIDTAASGDEGLALAYDKKYDIIFLDHMMPEKDGIETLHELRAREKDPNRETPTVCLTANAISGAREKYLAEGFDDYLTKPIDSARLEEMLMQYLPKEKLREAQEDEAAEETSETASFAQGIEGLDSAAGITNCGSEDALRGAMELFYRSAASDAETIEGFWHGGDLKNYTVKVHALKSAARTIGAVGLSEKAKAMEDAGNAGDTALIDEKTPELLAQYRAFADKLKPLFESGGEDDRPPIDAEELSAAYEALSECAGMMDYDMTEMALASLDKYRLPPEDAKRVEDIRSAMLDLDWESIAVLCK